MILIFLIFELKSQINAIRFKKEEKILIKNKIKIQREEFKSFFNLKKKKAKPILVSKWGIHLSLRSIDREHETQERWNNILLGNPSLKQTCICIHYFCLSGTAHISSYVFKVSISCIYLFHFILRDKHESYRI